MSDASQINPVGSTALMVARLRAIEGNRRDKLFEDPVASAFADERIAEQTDGFEAQSSGFAALLRVRLRWMDDVVERFLAQGGDQVVDLGGGCCTRAQRFSRPNVTFYEVDQPEVLAFKVDRLARAGYRYAAIGVPMDYTKPGQIQALLAHGLQPARRTLVTWEANTYYLPDDVLRTVLRTLSEMLPDLTVAVDYMSPEVIRGESASPWLKTIVPRLRTMGAPWLGSIEDMSRLAGDCGLEVAEEHSFGALKDRLLPHLDIGADRDAEYRFCILTRPRSSPPAS